MAEFPGDFIGKVPEVSFHKNRAEWKKDIWDTFMTSQ